MISATTPAPTPIPILAPVLSPVSALTVQLAYPLDLHVMTVVSFMYAKDDPRTEKLGSELFFNAS